MKKKTFFICLIFIAYLLPGLAQERNLLQNEIKSLDLSNVIQEPYEWVKYPDYENIEQWQNFPDSIKNQYIAQGEKYLNHDWEDLSLKLYTDYFETGNRDPFQDITFQRRLALTSLVMAELMENKGRFMNDILEGIWKICEETWWGVPAHLSEEQPIYPDIERPIIDLFAAETAGTLAWTHYLLKDKLDSVSPFLANRIYYELNRRIFIPYLERDDFWWMGFGERIPNNWNPWINSNVLSSVLLVENNVERRAKLVHKIIRSLDEFVNHYPADGGCDEGPHYWFRAAASLFDALELLAQASEQKINIYNEELIQKMAAYLRVMHIGDNYFVNFADASPKISRGGVMAFRFGRKVNDNQLMALGKQMVELNRSDYEYLPKRLHSFLRILPNLYAMQEVKAFDEKLKHEKQEWLPRTQVMTARFVSKGDELFLAVKGGHNDESHNHNDVGNFVVYADKKPVIIDVGVGTYTRKTFSAQRYDIWTMQSAFHNLPLINNHMQKYGAEYKAKYVDYTQRRNYTSFELDMATAYPETANVIAWKRKISISGTRKISLSDSYELAQTDGVTKSILMTPEKPEMVTPGKIRIPYGNNKKFIHLIYPPDKLSATIQIVNITDNKIQKSWGTEIYRILFTLNSKKEKDEYSIIIKR